MISKNQLKYLHSLRQGKYRQSEQAFIAEGTKLLGELLNSNFEIRQVFATEGWLLLNSNTLQEKRILFHEVSEDELIKISNLVTPNEVLAVVAMPEDITPDPEDAGKLILILDRLQDPGNMGTIIRTADWFGITHIFCSDDTVDIYNPKVVQSTMGSICRVGVHYQELDTFLNSLKGKRKVYGTSMQGKSIYTFEPNLPAAVIIGNESQGVSKRLLNLAEEKITIPSATPGAESLNAAVATGIICSEFTRKIDGRQ